MTELEHYGILGMKWGHRKTTSAEVSTSQSPKALARVNLKKSKEQDRAAIGKEIVAAYGNDARRAKSSEIGRGIVAHIASNILYTSLSQLTNNNSVKLGAAMVGVAFQGYNIATTTKRVRAINAYKRQNAEQ